jgi:hypothetical protein
MALHFASILLSSGDARGFLIFIDYADKESQDISMLTYVEPGIERWATCRAVSKCRICGDEEALPILDLGTQALSDVFPASIDQFIAG